MKVNALLLALLAASANAQYGIDQCEDHIQSLEECLENDATDTCKNCVSGKILAVQGDSLPDGADLAKLITDSVTSCEEEEATCQACAIQFDAYVACQAENVIQHS
eukprot:CAMPEP_0172527692 /NCGR_PEP_ID=MMETSP1067-20121228/2321_1 /TAXON_ID=265564 ORGANISM="Thalassiosira punctigera, Strain Tpunct2005C2" /NCGR_SAMPLE_ID=MMETSP1067 /ASSEMBLY_ACC=CAM_ASM_000444 /LENGTH=105 /DNA_ID=CAMNT_0013311485 /DNA_START=114 /DNA_END=431 /DNA_ORIENTATION=+